MRTSLTEARQVYLERHEDAGVRRLAESYLAVCEERDAYKLRVEALEGLNACLRVQRSPSKKLWAKLEKSRDALARLEGGK